jgi:hypothetical protein
LAPSESAAIDGLVVPTNPVSNAMQNESSILHTKGGWRDHSDGNRITTTLGDKVEVIRGNYKLIVLGRQDFNPHATPPISPAGMELSGGLIDTNSSDLLTPATSTTNLDQTLLNTEYVWEQASDGSWGWTLRTMTGSPKSSAFGAGNSGNGKTISYTWVDELWTFIGSPPAPARPSPFVVGQDSPPDAWPLAPGASEPQPVPVKKIVARTWGETILQEVRAQRATQSTTRQDPRLVLNSISDGTLNQLVASASNLTSVVETTSGGDLTSVVQTSAGGDLTSATQTLGGGNLISTLQSSGNLSNNVMATGAVNVATTSQAAINEFMFTPADHSLVDIALGMRSEIDVAIGMISEIKAAILIPEVKLGIHLDTHLLLHLDSHYGLHLEIHAGPHLQMCTALHSQMSEVSINTANLVSIGPGSSSSGAPPGTDDSWQNAAPGAFKAVSWGAAGAGAMAVVVTGIEEDQNPATGAAQVAGVQVPTSDPPPEASPPPHTPDPWEPL